MRGFGGVAVAVFERLPRIMLPESIQIRISSAPLAFVSKTRQ